MSNLYEINQRIREFITSNYPRARQQLDFDDDQSLFASGIVDSLGALELVFLLEREFKITVSDEDLLPQNFETIRGLSNFVQSRRDGDSVA